MPASSIGRIRTLYIASTNGFMTPSREDTTYSPAIAGSNSDTTEAATARPVGRAESPCDAFAHGTGVRAASGRPWKARPPRGSGSVSEAWNPVKSSRSSGPPRTWRTAHQRDGGRRLVGAPAPVPGKRFVGAQRRGVGYYGATHQFRAVREGLRPMPSEALLTAEEQVRSMQDDPGIRAVRSHP